MLVNIHYSPGKMFAVHSPWLNATWSLTLWSPEQDEPSLEGRSAECGPQLPTTPPATTKIFRRPSQQHSWAPRKGGEPFCASTGSHLCSPGGSALTHPGLPGGAPSLTCKWATARSIGRRPRSSCQLEMQTCADHQRPSPSTLAKQNPVSTGSEEERWYCLLQALPCPPVWTSGTECVRAVLEQLSPEPGQGGRGEGCFGKALPAKFLRCWIKA